MTRNASIAISPLCLVVAAGLVLGSCDKTPTRPGPIPPPPPGPTVQRSTGPVSFVSNRDGTDAIYLANEDGSAVTRLTEGWGPAWSKDGRRLAFVNAHNVYVINVDGSGLRRIAPGYRPSWAPDGALIALDDFQSIYTVDANGSNRRAIYSEHSPIQPVWSPDGGLIAFSITEYIDFFPGLGVMSADGSAVRYIGPHDAWAPAWSPDGSQITFLTHSGISVIATDGSGERQLVAARDISNVDWTPNGSLVFGRWITASHADGPSRIFISDGSERQLIPDARSPARQSYRDWQVAWLR